MGAGGKRCANSSGIEARVAGDRNVVKQLLQEALNEFLEVEIAEALGVGPSERTARRLG